MLFYCYCLFNFVIQVKLRYLYKVIIYFKKAKDKARCANYLS